MMQISPQLILAIVGALMLALGIADIARHRRLTPGAKGRLLVALIFALVLAWNHWHLP